MALLSHRQGWCLAVALSFFPCIFSATNTDGAPEPTYRTGASEVRVAFFATDGNDRLVGTLSTKDFAVVDTGIVVRDFRSLARSSETALDIVVLVDASESVGRGFEETVDVVRRLMLNLPRMSADRLSVVTFSELQPRALCTGNCQSASAE